MSCDSSGATIVQRLNFNLSLSDSVSCTFSASLYLEICWCPSYERIQHIIVLSRSTVPALDTSASSSSAPESACHWIIQGRFELTKKIRRSLNSRLLRTQWRAFKGWQVSLVNQPTGNHTVNHIQVVPSTWYVSWIY